MKAGLPAIEADALQLLPMTVADVDRVMAVEAAAYSFPWTRGNFIDSIAAGHLLEMLVDADGRLLGYYAAMPGVDELHLLNLTVAPAHRRRGHARTLLRTLTARARARGLSALWLEVRVGNEPAIALYRQWGFIQTGLRRGYYPAAAGRREDAVVMSWVLPPPDEEGGDGLE